MLNPRHLMPTVASGFALAIAAPATAQDSAQIQFRAGGTYSSDPFLVAGEGTADSGAVALSFEALPQLTWERETSTVRLSGQIRYEEWLDRYNSDLSGQVSLDGQQQASETLQIFGGISYLTSQRPIPELFGNTLSTDELGDVIQFVGPFDPTIDGEFQRRHGATATLGLEKQLSETQALNVELSSAANWFEANGLDYRTASLNTSFSQSLSPRVSMVVALSGSVVDYADQPLGDGVLGNATVGLNVQLSETGSLSTSGGLAIARVDTGMGQNETQEFLIANVTLCEESGRSSFCATGSRETRPTTVGGASTVTSAGLGWNRQIGERSSFSLNGSYTDTKAQLGVLDVLGAQRFKYASASMRYSTGITDKIGFYIAPSIIKLFDDPLGRGSNYQVSVGLSYTLGR